MRGSGRAAFVAALLLIVGTLNIIYGIGSVGDATALVGDQRLVFTSLHTYGWVLIILGVIQLTAGLSLLGGNTYGRVLGIVAASLGALNALAAIGGRNPWWSLGAFALCIYILHGLIIFGRDEKASEAY
jgi:signal transduction histidine kinase